jgi:phosphate starvation-inducible protein PhoH
MGETYPEESIMGSPNGNLQLSRIKALNPRQKAVLASNKNLVVHGAAGTGKTLLVLYRALVEVEQNRLEKVIIMRSAVPTRNIGFLPGSASEKTKVYEAPYMDLASQLYGKDEAYTMLKRQKKVEFVSTSFIRGINTENCFLIVDEFQNMNFHELDSIITRLGKNCKIAFSGDAGQADLQNNGLKPFMNILQRMPDLFDIVEFGIEDIVRSELVKRYLTEKHKINEQNTNDSNVPSLNGVLIPPGSVLLKNGITVSDGIEIPFVTV